MNDSRLDAGLRPGISTFPMKHQILTMRLSLQSVFRFCRQIYTQPLFQHLEGTSAEHWFARIRARRGVSWNAACGWWKPSRCDRRVTVLQCRERTPKRVKQPERQWTWITDLPVTRAEAPATAWMARGHWKIENETFNTLKNQGYGLEHNYGHGHRHLANTLATLMMLAFLID